MSNSGSEDSAGENTEDDDPILGAADQRSDSEQDSGSARSDQESLAWTEDWAKENARRFSYLSPDVPLWVARRRQSREKQARIVSLEWRHANKAQIQAFVDFLDNRHTLLVVPPSMACDGCRGNGSGNPYVCVLISSRGKRSCVGCASKPCKFACSFKDIIFASCVQQTEQLRKAVKTRAEATPVATARGVDAAAQTALPLVEKIFDYFSSRLPDVEEDQ